MGDSKKKPVSGDEPIPADIDKIRAEDQEAFRRMTQENMARQQAQSGWISVEVPPGDNVILDPNSATKLRVGSRGFKKAVPVPPPTPLAEFMDSAGKKLLREMEQEIGNMKQPERRKRLGRPQDKNLYLRNLSISAAVELAVRDDEYMAINSKLNTLDKKIIEKYNLNVSIISRFLEWKERKIIFKNNDGVVSDWHELPDDLFESLTSGYKLKNISSIYEDIAKQYTISEALVKKTMEGFPGRGRRFRRSNQPCAVLKSQRAWLFQKKKKSEK